MQQFVPEHKLLSRLADNTAVTLTGRTPHVTVRKKARRKPLVCSTCANAGPARPRSGANMKKVGALLVIWLAVAAAAQQADSNPPEQQAPQGTLLNNAGF